MKKISSILEKMLLIIISFGIIATFSHTHACNCIDPNQLASRLRAESIILYINITALDVDTRLEENQAEKIEVKTQKVRYELLKNISNSKIELLPFLVESYTVLETFDQLADCDCGLAINSQVNAYQDFNVGDSYIVFIQPRNNSLILHGSILINNGLTATSFPNIPAGTEIDKVIVELERVDDKEYLLERSGELVVKGNSGNLSWAFVFGTFILIISTLSLIFYYRKK